MRNKYSYSFSSISEYYIFIRLFIKKKKDIIKKS